MKERRLFGLATMILILLVLALVRCQPDAPQPFPDPESFEAETLPAGPQLPEVTLRPGQDLVAEQIVLTGGGADIDLVLGELPELALEQISSSSYDYLERYPPPDDGRIDFQQQTQGKRLRAAGNLQIAPQLRLDLYQFTAGTPPLADTLQAIAAKVEERQADLQLGVVAEPNYVVGFEITGDPWGVEGSPWGVEGSPWGVEGSGEEAAVYSSDSFWDQWALLESPGINLRTSGAEPGESNIDNDGAGVQVAVFDSSPFNPDGGYRFVGWGPPRIEPLALTVSHPVALPTSQPDEDTNISDHGLFVSGLVYAAAPGSDIHLIRVLNSAGQGTLQAFVDALNIYIRARLAAQGSLQNTVINLSLGTSEPDDAELPLEARRAIARMLSLWYGREVDPAERLPVLSLEVPMRIANVYGASVVAAAGNDSAEVAAASPLPSQIPAAYDSVVGVEAGNQTPGRSCYSNEGILLAPGGDGDAAEDGSSDCVPAHTTCDAPDCPYGVISYALVATKGFAFWVGSSFATPLASGVAADVIEARGAPRPDEVQDILLCSAQGSGVLDAVAALNACP